MMFLRALFAFLTLPAVVGGLVPWLLLPNDRWRGQGTVLGWLVLLFGALVLLWCVRDFYVIGKGTLAPWDPPKTLVILGLYRFMRNPMYVGVLGCVAGWSLVAGSPVLAAYAAMLAVAFHLRVIFYEEPTLARQFGYEWTQYHDRVNRWLPRVGRNISGDGNRWTPDRPNSNPGFSNDPTSGVSKGCAALAAGTPLGTPDLWYDPCAFSRPATGTYGNVGRNTLTGPGFDDIDASLAKVFKPSGEQLNVQLRAEVFNLFDHANFYVPAFNVFSGSAGHVTRLVSNPGGRLIQLALKVNF